jgi:hypothetical protein
MIRIKTKKPASVVRSGLFMQNLLRCNQPAPTMVIVVVVMVVITTSMRVNI